MLVHNEYKSKGGEDTVLELEYKLLEKHGHQVELYTVSNDEINVGKATSKIRAGLETIWSRKSYKNFLEVLQEKKPDIIHVHNTFPMLSPSVYWAASKKNIPIVQTLHNYRLTCANALLMKDGKPCELCVGAKFPIEAIKNRCYRDSISATSAIVGMQMTNKMIGTYKNKVDGYITLTEFAKNIMVESGLPDRNLYVKPNFIPDPIENIKYSKNEEGIKKIVFVGRITYEKGVDLLLDAWSKIDKNKYELVIVGDGPEKEKLQKKYGEDEQVNWRGWLNREEVLQEISESNFIVMPSRWYEGFPMVIVESLALGTPAIVPNHAGFPEIINDNQEGYFFKPGEKESLELILEKGVNTNLDDLNKMKKNSRNRYLAHYTEEQNYSTLINIYRMVKEKK